MSRMPPEPGLPAYSVPLQGGTTLRLTPPFVFEGMTARAFPLRARQASLQRLCDRYLNIIPAELGRFRAPAPFVLLQLVNYGRMAIEVANSGWLAQREIAFTVPLEWHRLVDGRWVFQDWAFFSPFIFVDDDMSMSVGRSVYGWPKAIARLSATGSSWMEDPLAPITEARLSTTVFPTLYGRRRLEEREFLEIARAAPTSTLGLPFDASNPLAPWTIASNLAAAAAGFGLDYAGLLAGLGIWPMHPSGDAENVLAKLERLAWWSYPMGPDRAANTINLKQIRSAPHPERYSFQAITNAQMRFTAFHRGGLLGEQRMLLGDASGGFSIRLHDWASLPILQTLGLAVERSWDGPECRVAELPPVFPSWCDLDVQYLPGYNVAWRTEDDPGWRDASGRRVGRPAAPPVPENDQLFNTTLGTTSNALAGPFTFRNLTVRVLPLLAVRSVLESLLESYLNVPLRGSGRKFRLWAGPEGAGEFAYVYLTANVFDRVISGTNDVGDWANGELTFFVPVQLWRETADGEKLCGVGLVPALSYADTATAVASGVEVLGMPVARADFQRPESAWMSRVEPGEESLQALLRVSTEILPATGEGQEARMETSVGVTMTRFMDAIPTAAERRIAARHWASILGSEVARQKEVKSEHPHCFDVLRAVALEVLCRRVPLSIFTLKQLRDVADPDRACYQSLVGIHRTIASVLDVREIEMQLPLVVSVQDPPSHPLVSTLGLVATEVAGEGTGHAFVLLPQRPFWLRLHVEENLGSTLCRRTAGNGWRSRRSGGDGGPGSYVCRSSPTKVTADVVPTLDEGDPSWLTWVATTWNDWRLARREADPIGRDEVAAAVRQIDPQMVIASMLSREWSNQDECPRWLALREQLDGALQELLAGEEDPDARSVAETRFFEALLREFDRDIPQDPELDDPRDMLLRLGELYDALGAVKSAWAACETAARSGGGVTRMDVRTYRDALAGPREDPGARRVIGIPFDPKRYKANVERSEEILHALARYTAREDGSTAPGP
jgi:hypothetical protein